jgi:hypothetical protein
MPIKVPGIAGTLGDEAGVPVITIIVGSYGFWVVSTPATTKSYLP